MYRGCASLRKEPTVSFGVEAAGSLITLVLCGALLVTAGALIFRGVIVRFPP